MLIFILQSVWLYITELAGKDLDIEIVFKFLIYVSPRLVVLVLPLTILLSSIMVFGSFAENYEFAAMKSTGISLQRAMRSLSVFIFLLSVLTFFFANNVIPSAEFKFNSLRRNIAKVKPAMAIAEGQFTQIKDINIKVAKKTGERGQFLEDVIIHKKNGNKPGNNTVIKSKTGELTSSEGSDILQLVLFDGYYHDDLQPSKFQERQKSPHLKSQFEKYTLNIDLAQLNDVDFNDETTTTRHSMLTVKDLDYTIDTLVIKKQEEYDVLALTMYNRTSIPTLDKNITISEEGDFYSGENILDLFGNSQNNNLIDLAINNVNSSNQIIQAKKRLFGANEKNLNKHIISYYDKFAIGIACIILFFIGAPLGALIRKGGLGLPIIVAILFFLTYHFIGIFAKNSAEDGSLNPALAPWFAALVMLPLSIYLTNRATKDRNLFDLDALLIPIRNAIGIKSLTSELNAEPLLDKDSEDYVHLNGYSDKKLIDLLKNYRQYDRDVSYRNTSLQILAARGITEDQLKFSGNLVNDNYENALRYQHTFSSNSKIAMIFYIVAIIGDIVGAVLRNNGFPSIGLTLMIIGIIATVFYLISFAKTFPAQSSFYKLLGKNTIGNNAVIILFGFPLFFIYMIFFNKKMKEDLKEIR